MSFYDEFKEDRNALTDYLLLKVKQRDWHAVSDAANDLRVLEAKYETRNEIQTTESAAVSKTFIESVSGIDSAIVKKGRPGSHPLYPRDLFGPGTESK